jgi:RHS repeat-associated protein
LVRNQPRRGERLDGHYARELYFIHTDHLDTPRLVANQAGQTVWRWDQQEPFGVTVPDENPNGLGAFEFPLRFPGQYFDKETNLFYNYFRDYESSIGRYVQSDPIGLHGGLNTYAYALGNPLAKSDRLGLAVSGTTQIAMGWLLEDPVTAAQKAGQAAGIVCASSIPCHAGNQQQNLINARCQPLLSQIGDGRTAAPVAYDACLQTCRAQLNKLCNKTSMACS